MDQPQRRRLRALTRAAYSATAGHLEIDPEPAEPRETRWLPGTRAVVVTAGVLVLLGGFLALRAWAGPSHEPVALPPEGSSAIDDAEAAQAHPEAAGDEATASDAATDASRPAEEDSAAAAQPAQIVVHVAGQVAEPGVVQLPEDSRVMDALEEAGGTLDEADLAAVNLARPLVDGEQVYFPRQGEEVPAPTGPPPADDSSNGAPAEAVDLNTATEQELTTLPGIGPAIAGRIVVWREENGGFSHVEELEEVSGIGPSIMGDLRELVTV